jgi:hypothetical protein
VCYWFCPRSGIFLEYLKRVVRSASQQMSRLLWNQKFRYRVNKIPTPVSIQSPINPILTFQNYFTQKHVHPFAPMSSEYFLPFTSLNQILLLFLISPVRAITRIHLFILDFIFLIYLVNSTYYGVHYYAIIFTITLRQNPEVIINL